MAFSRTTCLALLLLGCGTSAEPAPERERPEPGAERMPPPAEVCILESTGHRARATVTPHWGGMYGPEMPVVPENLNWQDEGGHCVTPPVGDLPRVPCPDGEPIPLVTPALCQR